MNLVVLAEARFPCQGFESTGGRKFTAEPNELYSPEIRLDLCCTLLPSLIIVSLFYFSFFGTFYYLRHSKKERVRSWKNDKSDIQMI